MMKDVGIKVVNLRISIFILIGLIAVFGSIVHRVFLVQWILGILLGFYIISKSFPHKSFFTIRRIIALVAVMLISFGSLESLSRNPTNACNKSTF